MRKVVLLVLFITLVNAFKFKDFNSIRSFSSQTPQNEVITCEDRTVCCPNECNSANKRGECLSFSRDLVCKCYGNFYGKDCSQCMFGYTGPNCDQPAPIYTRKDWRCLTNEEKQIFFDTMNKGKSIVQTFAASHSSILKASANNLHIPLILQNENQYLYSEDPSSIFPTWHRLFLLQLERELQKINPKFSFPYWDWRDITDINSESIIKEFGGNGYVLAPFADWGLARSLNNLKIPTTADVSKIITASEFSPIGHKIVLYSVGGHMASLKSSSDPIFYLHLCFYDLLFEQWLIKKIKDFQKSGGPSPTEPLYGLAPYSTRSFMFRTTQELGYEYMAPPNLPRFLQISSSSSEQIDGYCLIVKDECKENNGGCHPNAVCTNTVGNRICVCKAGYVGNGIICNDVNECATNNGGCAPGETCQNTDGGRNCIGVTTDPCFKENGGCHLYATCSNANGVAKCVCKTGFTGDGKLCTDVDKCSVNRGGCDPNALCINTAGSRDCLCKDGFTGDGIKCSDINECLQNNGGCNANAVCTNAQGYRICTCKPNYEGDGYTTCTQMDPCKLAQCSANALCSSSSGKAVCTCKTGFSGDGKVCADVNECSSNNGGCKSNEVCYNTVGSRMCQVSTDPCFKNGGCSNYATCSVVNGVKNCACKSGFTGNGVTCTDIDECLTQNGGCHFFATCKNEIGSRTCTCKTGLYGNGITCSVHPCFINNGGCGSNGLCFPDPSARNLIRCTCKSGFTGPSCVDINECATNNGGCNANAFCINTPGSFDCRCKSGYIGNGKICLLFDPCAKCSPKANCVSVTPYQGLTKKCICKPGYFGDGNSCTDINECLVKNGGCSSNALCINTDGSRSCKCKSLYVGDGLRCTCALSKIPLYRYFNGKDHFYTSNAAEIGTTTIGATGKSNYKFEGVVGYLPNQGYANKLPIYRYWNNVEHFYTTTSADIGTITPGETGKSGYKSEGLAGFILSVQVKDSVPLYRYWNNVDHFYTTNLAEIGVYQLGGTGTNGYKLEGYVGFVFTSGTVDVCLQPAKL